MERRDLTIDERTYSLLVPPVRVSMAICSKVAVLVGPLLATIGKDVVKEGGWEKFAEATKQINPEKLDALLMESIHASKLTCHGQPISAIHEFEKHFGQYRGDVYQVSLWCLWECVKDFFPQLGAFNQMAQNAMSTGFPSQKGGQ